MLRQPVSFYPFFIALCMVQSVFFPSNVQAEGSLRLGELVVATTGGSPSRTILARVDLQRADAESIAVFEQSYPLSVVIRDRNTVFLLLSSNNTSKILEVDVRSGSSVVLFERSDIIPPAQGLGMQANGDLLLLINEFQNFHGEVLHIDKDTQLTTTLASSPLFYGSIGRIAALPNGDIFVQDCKGLAGVPGKTFRLPVENPSQLELVFEGSERCSDMHSDPLSGDLLLTAPVPMSIEEYVETYIYTPELPATLEEYIEGMRALFGDFIDLVGLLGVDPLSHEASVVIPSLLGSYWAGQNVAKAVFALGASDELYLNWNFEIQTFDLQSGVSSRVFESINGRDIAVMLPACANGLDDDGDGFVDAVDPHCSDPLRDNEQSGCSDGIDNDADGQIDLADTDCPDDLGDGEIPDCADNIDNDGDGLIDRFDEHCLFAFDASEFPECSDGLDNNNNGYIDGEDALCFFAEQACEAMSCPELLPACSDGYDNDDDGYFDYPEDPQCNNPLTQSELPACSDGLDNDDDGFIDLFDDDCDELTGNGELSPCNDGKDNDLDGKIDFGEDPGCSSLTDISELQICADGFDNDGDELTDLEDPDCRHSDDRSEEPRQCSDGIDNDGDGKIDFVVNLAGENEYGGPGDPHCYGPEDDDESTDVVVCSASLGSTPATLPVTAVYLLLFFVLLWRRHSRDAVLNRGV